MYTSLSLSALCWTWTDIYIYIYCLHTHTHIYIYINICVCACVCVCAKRMIVLVEIVMIRNSDHTPIDAIHCSETQLADVQGEDEGPPDAARATDRPLGHCFCFRLFPAEQG